MAVFDLTLEHLVDTAKLVHERAARGSTRGPLTYEAFRAARRSRRLRATLV